MNTGEILERVSKANPDELKQIQSVLCGKPKRRRLGSTKDACTILNNCHPETLRRYEQRGHLNAIRHSKRKLRWDLDEVEAFANSGVSNTEGGEE